MVESPKKTVVPGENKPDRAEARADARDCRCEETSKMTPRELIALMMKDLAFWKRRKDG